MAEILGEFACIKRKLFSISLLCAQLGVCDGPRGPSTVTLRVLMVTLTSSGMSRVSSEWM
jgi:hypothetical protein